MSATFDSADVPDRKPLHRRPTLRSALARALTADTPSVARLSNAAAVVRFEVVGEDESATLLLDRRPPQVASADEPPDVVIELSADQAAQFVRGRLALPSAVVAGHVAAYGAVRRYLTVDPILRDLLLAQASREEEDHDGDQGRDAATGPF